METIRGIATRFLKRDEETGRVFALIRYQTATGLVDATMGATARDLEVGDFFVADGVWRADKEFRGKVEETFNAFSLRPDLPDDKASAALWFSTIFTKDKHGVTPQSAAKFVESLGAGAAAICEREPDRIIGLSASPQQFRAEILKEWGRRISGRRAVRLLEDSGVKPRAIAAVLDAYRDDTYERLQANPYSAARVPDFGFANADQVGGKIGIGIADDRRVTASILEAIETSRREGDTYTSLKDIETALDRDFSIPPATLKSFAERNVQNQNMPFVFDRVGDRIVAMARELFVAERLIAKSLVRLLSEGRSNDRQRAAQVVRRILAAEDFKKFDEIQSAAVLMAVTEPVSILTGGPGTGKSTVTEAIAMAAEQLDGAKILLCAPTGKATKRLEETTGREASTVHRMLGAKLDLQTGRTVFSKNRSNPLPPGVFVVVDEASMLDAETMYALLEAMPGDGRLLLVGDKNQLPSVDAGSVLADMLAARTADGNLIVPRTELLNVYRQSRNGRIATGAAEIRQGMVPFLSNRNDGGLMLQERDTPDIVERIKEIVKKVFIDHLNYKPHHFAILCPQAPGPAGTWELNREISQMLNRYGKNIPGVSRGADDNPAMPLPRVGDRVMLTENDDANDVMNGDVGTITGTFAKPSGGGERQFITVEFDCGKTVEYPAATWRKLILAYAITVHKSQGSQYQAVIMPVTMAHENMLDRSILYTGWTRAKGMLALVGQREAIQMAVDNTDKARRNTRLAEFLVRSAAEARYEPDRPAPPEDAPKAPARATEPAATASGPDTAAPHAGAAVAPVASPPPPTPNPVMRMPLRGRPTRSVAPKAEDPESAPAFAPR